MSRQIIVAPTTVKETIFAVESLAVFGAPPAFEDPLHVGRPNIGDRKAILARMEEMLDRNWLSNNGPFVQEFEARIAEAAGVKHCIAACNATVALELAIRALGMKGEVIVPSFTFIATAHALQWQEITPVFCDIDPHTRTLDPKKVESLITARTTGIIGVHLWGQPCDVEGLADVAQRHNLKLLYDAAHAFGCSHKGKMVGGFGDAEVYSFHATKFLNAFEGGAIVTNDDDLARRLRLMKNFGFDGPDSVVYLGINGKMTEACAAMGLASLECMHTFVEVNRRNMARYDLRLTDLPGVVLLTDETLEQRNYQYVIVEVDEESAGLSRDALLKVLHAENILARRYFYPCCHRMEPYKTLFPEARLRLPHTERLSERVLCLPTGTAMNEATIDAVCDVIWTAVRHAGEVKEKLAEGS
jgi:dTDP-4-amino-4,6-dideoxygalactose transaminase